MMRRLCSSCLFCRGHIKYRGLTWQEAAKKGLSTEVGIKKFKNEFKEPYDINYLQLVMDEDGEQFLAGLRGKKLKQKENLEMTIETWRAEGYENIPDKLSPGDWKVLLSMNYSDLKEIMRYLKVVCIRSEKRLEMAKQTKFNLDLAHQPYDDEDLNIIARTFQLRKQLNHWNGVQSLMYGRPVVVDLDYDVRDQHGMFKTAQQVEQLCKLNFEHVQPCHLHLTSMHKNTYLHRMLSFERNFLADIYTENFLEIFPRERLFYLVPEGPMIQEEKLDEDLIFVFGGIADTRERKRSWTKAELHSIPYGSLPLDMFVSRKARSTSDIHLHVVMKIMLDKFNDVSWKTSLDRHLPDQKFVKYPDLYEKNMTEQTRSRSQFHVLEKSLKLSKRT